MKYRRSVLALLVLLACDAAAGTATDSNTAADVAIPTGELAMVVDVADGDTMRVRFPDGTEDQVRLIGIDAQEQGGDFAEAAAAFLSDLVTDRVVRLVTDIRDRDRFGRLLRYAYVGDVFVNEAMVRAGLAVAKRYEPDTAMAAILEEAQRQARDQEVGIWAHTASTRATPP